MPAASGDAVSIRVAETQRDLDRVRALFREYGSDVSRSYCLNGFDGEVTGLPGDYGPSGGCLLLALADDQPVACGGLRPLGPGVAEMKRLFVRDGWQGAGLGRRIAGELVGRARVLGYDRVRLDTLNHMTAAQALYLSMGFREIAPYHDDVAPGMKFMELDL